MLPIKTSVSILDDELRVRAEYARREREIPGSTYSAFNPVNLAIRQNVERRILKLFGRYDLQKLEHLKVLEVGCGTGYWLRSFIFWGAQPENLRGVDLVLDRIRTAQKLTASGVRFETANAAKLEMRDEEFDLVCQFTMFSSVLSSEIRYQIASEMLRVLKPSGHLLWYDFFVNNPRNPNVRGVTHKEIERLFPGTSIDLARITVAPPILRALGKAAFPLYPLFDLPKVLCTHYLGLFTKQ